GFDGAAVQLHQALHERQANSQTPERLTAAVLELREHVKDPVERIRGNADPVILYRNDDAGTCRADSDTDAARPRGVLAGVVQQIAEYLHEPRGIRIQVDGRFGQREVDTVPAPFRELGACLDRLAQHVAQTD